NRSSQTDILGALDRVVLAPPFDRSALVLFYMSGDLQKILGPFSDFEYVDVAPTPLAKLSRFQKDAHAEHGVAIPEKVDLATTVGGPVGTQGRPLVGDTNPVTLVGVSEQSAKPLFLGALFGGRVDACSGKSDPVLEIVASG